MRTVWKYTLQRLDRQSLQVPTGAEFLCVQWQGQQLCAWALVETERPKEIQHFLIVGTGNPIPKNPEYLHFLGTIQELGGALVWHVFREIK